jgi:hypothetical protein
MHKVVLFLIVSAAVIAPAAIAIGAAQFTASASMSPDAKAYLDRAIMLFREHHINSAKMDWPAVTKKAYAAAAGAKTTADTYPAIWLVIRELGEKHTGFVDPDHAKAETTGKASGKASAPSFSVPKAMRLVNGVGVIRLDGFTGSPEQAELYAQTGQTEINQLKVRGVCKFIVDLRFDTGGNMYPMISAVGGLLHEGVLGTFEYANGKFQPWLLNDRTTKVGTISDAEPHANSAAPNSLPVAVLIGPSTASAGEYTAMSFKGRSNTRFFGAPTAGYITANRPIPLSDGAVIIMTAAWGIDRTGKKYVDAMQPDEMRDADGPFDPALKWLAGQPCPRSTGQGAQ